jgi:SAM-dependent methyltransferase
MAIVNAHEHYERLVDEGFDAHEYPEPLRQYQERWDGPRFFDLLGDLQGKSVVEIGVGGGRLAKETIARGCKNFTGIDFSPKTIAQAKQHFLKEKNVELIVADAVSFVRPEAFDVAFSVLTFLHIENKQKALANIVGSLRPGGHLVLSISLVRYALADGEEDWLDYGIRKVRLFSAPPASYVCWLEQLGCRVDEPVDLVDAFVHPNGKKSQTYGEPVAALVRAVKPDE